jgi:hypothetical protein
LREVGVRARVLGGGGFAIVNASAGSDSVDAILAVAEKLGLVAYPRDATPPGILASNPRFGDVVVFAPVGMAISGRLGPPMRGSHGYLPAEPGMGALLVAAGGSIRPGQRLDAVDALDIAPTLLSWLEISPPEWMEGRPIAGLTGNPRAAPTTFEQTEEAK